MNSLHCTSPSSSITLSVALGGKVRQLLLFAKRQLHTINTQIIHSDDVAQNVFISSFIPNMPLYTCSKNLHPSAVTGASAMQRGTLIYFASERKSAAMFRRPLC